MAIGWQRLMSRVALLALARVIYGIAVGALGRSRPIRHARQGPGASVPPPTHLERLALSAHDQCVVQSPGPRAPWMCTHTSTGR